jgi:alanine racemase
MEIDLDALLHNYREIVKHVAPAQVVPVVKSEAYGHGAVPIARALQEEGCRHMAVAMVDEGIQLRRAGIKGEIMILGVTLPEQFSAMAEHRLTPSLGETENIALWARTAQERGEKLPYHLKVDVGLGRLGFLPDKAERALSAALSTADRLVLRGIHSHLSHPEGTLEHNARELARYESFCRPFLAHFPDVARHLAASQAVLRHPHMYFDLVRVGGLLYGFDYGVPTPMNLRPVLTYKTRVGQVKTIPAGWGIGYDLERVVDKPTTLALLPLGWSDGVGSTHVGKASFLVGGEFAPLVGICTDFAMLDVSNIAGVQKGDEVVLVGRQGPREQKVIELARAGGISTSQLLGRAALRVPRVFFRDGRQVDELSILA